MALFVIYKHVYIMDTNSNKPGGNAGRFLLGNLCILTSTIFFGVNIPVVKLLIPTWMTDIDVTLFRILGGCALMWIASLFVKTRSIDRQDWKSIVLGGALGLFSFLFLFNMSLRYANPIDVSIIMTFPPVFVILIGVIFKGQRPSWLEYLGIVVSFVGAFLVIVFQHGGHAGSDDLLGDILAFVSTACYAFYLVIMEGTSKKYSPVNLLRWVFLFAAIPALFFIGDFFKAPIFHSAETLTPWLWVGFIILCPTFLSYFLINPADKMIGSELVSLYQYFLPVVAAIASVLMGVAKLHTIQIVAMGVIIIGMVMTNLGKRRRAQG